MAAADSNKEDSAATSGVNNVNFRIRGKPWTVSIDDIMLFEGKRENARLHLVECCVEFCGKSAADFRRIVISFTHLPSLEALVLALSLIHI